MYQLYNLDALEISLYMQVGLQREMTPQVEPLPTGSDEQVKVVEGEETIVTSVDMASGIGIYLIGLHDWRQHDNNMWLIPTLQYH